MQPLINKIQQHINSLTVNELSKFLKRIIGNTFDPDLGLESHYRQQLIQLITDGYDECVLELNAICSQTIQLINQGSELIPEAFYNYSEEGEVNMAYQIYRNLKFHKSDQVISFFKTRGIRDVFLTHFVDIDHFEEVFFTLIKSGILLNAKYTLIIIDMVYNMRIAKELNAYFIQHKIRDVYDGRKNVSEGEISLLNTFRRLNQKNNPKKEKNKPVNPIEALIKQLERADATFDTHLANFVKQAMLGVAREDQNIAKDIFMEFFRPLLKIYTVLEIKNMFKPLFHLFFENTKEGLLNEEGFVKQYADTDLYDGKYQKYYQTRLDTLIGFKEMK